MCIRDRKSATDYYVAGRSMTWWQTGISVMATQSSAISFLSIPAFVAIKANGGLTWLQNEIAVPVAMIWVMATLIPVFRRMELVSVYEFVEYRFGQWGYRLISLMFLISRGLSTASGLYSGAIVIAICLGTSTSVAVWVMGIITVCALLALTRVCCWELRFAVHICVRQGLTPYVRACVRLFVSRHASSETVMLHPSALRAARLCVCMFCSTTSACYTALLPY